MSAEDVQLDSCDIPGCEAPPIAHDRDFDFYHICEEHMKRGDKVDLILALKASRRILSDEKEPNR